MIAKVTLPRRLVEIGGAIEGPDGIWHIAKSDRRTFCEKRSVQWPRVANAVERAGIWCGLCLHAASREVAK